MKYCFIELKYEALKKVFINCHRRQRVHQS